jgi:transcriptional regulator with PAS, ATPase and Fis domain
MGDVTTLITGPSGTGKELVARAIGLSRYIPFDTKARAFEEDFAGSFHALNLSALSPTLIESELFGHRRGSFTGALEDRAGWLEVCRPSGAVFLDEVGEIAPPIQVKMLRVLQTRTFQRLGDTQARPFLGKVVAATNRDLAREMREGRFREDFYYRICSDQVTTPSLHELLAGSADEVHRLVLFVARRVAGVEAETLASEVEAWIGRNLGRDYRWPGNFRELEQCVRNVLVRGAYRPAAELVRAEAGDDLAAAIGAGSLTADDLVARYCAAVYARSGSYERTARSLGLDRRTVKAKVDRAAR